MHQGHSPSAAGATVRLNDGRTLGYTEYVNPAGGVLFYFHVAIASNESFSGWTKTFTDPRLRAAIVDRLTFGGHIIETGTDSYRLARSKAVAAAR